MLRTRLNELPALIDAANSCGDANASELLRRERGDLELYVPALESECQMSSHEALSAQIAQCEQELLEAEMTLQIATRFSESTYQEFQKLGHPLDAQTGAAQGVLDQAQAQMV